MSVGAPRLRRTWHLAKRFVGALVPGGPSHSDEAWVKSVLPPALFAEWRSMPGHDRRHSIGVARRTRDGLRGVADMADDPEWVAAALVHDVGKLDAGLGVPGRVVATLTRGVLGQERTDRWVERRGVRLRFARYFRHGALGADRIRAAGGSEATARWAAAHHDPSRWAETGIPPAVMAALDAADDD
ncbi:MAG TPA: hypothetical protein VFW06_00115 [Acidimicrobiia bacterium]|nr:hypothetical protein [Acidimicrobiia bacterium]